MKVKELRAAMSELPDDMKVIVFADHHGYYIAYSNRVSTVVEYDGEFEIFNLDDEEELEYFEKNEYNEYPHYKAFIILS